jgi:ABC-type antimicrobial peptide transport system permease subunit
MKNNTPHPPRWAHQLLVRLAAPHLREELEGDLEELFRKRLAQYGYAKACLWHLLDLLLLVHPRLWRRPSPAQVGYFTPYPPTTSLRSVMIQNYLTVAFRNLVRNRVYSFLNLFGLASGMAVALLIGLWLQDELSFDQTFQHYDRIAKVWQIVQFDVEKASYDVMPVPLAEELRSNYSDFESVSLSCSRNAVLATGDQAFTRTGNYVEPDFAGIFSVKLLSGSLTGLADVNAILLSETTARLLFGSADPMNRLIKIDSKRDVKVAGVYADFPGNSSFHEVTYLAPWALLVALNENAKRDQHEWDSNAYQIFTQLKPGADFERVSAKIKDIRMKRADPPGYKPAFFLHPMRKWHLFSEFKDGVNTGGLITFVWLFGSIGVIVLLLASINFMNLATARSEKRAKEVGVRKAMGSLRGQLIAQFFSESLLLALLAFGLAVVLAQLSLPFFNQVAGKLMSIRWSSPWFWLFGLGFSLLTGLIAGSYPALYLSSFQPVEVLKGTFSASRFSALPRRVLVCFQFTVSVTLMIGTVIIFRQIHYAKDRPSGYTRSGLIELQMQTSTLVDHYQTLRHDLLQTGGVANMSASWGSVTVQDGGTTAVSWRGKATDARPLLMSNLVTHDYGKTIGWQLKQGRDFSRAFSTDSSAIILNEAAVKLMGFNNPVGELVKWSGRDYLVIGVIGDMIKEDPFKPVNPSFFVLDYRHVATLNIRLSPQLPTQQALAKVEAVWKTYNPATPFDYQFVDAQYAQKFAHEVRIGQLAAVFAGLAILISCLGLFGLTSFLAEQRRKELGIRKVLGASVFNLWGLLSKEFVGLVLLAFCLGAPLAYYFLSDWLENYTYRTPLSWWIFALSGAGALAVTLLTVSFQSIKAALINPVKSLRNE